MNRKGKLQLVGKIQGPLANAVSLVSQAYGVAASAERLTEENLK